LFAKCEFRPICPKAGFSTPCTWAAPAGVVPTRHGESRFYCTSWRMFDTTIASRRSWRSLPARRTGSIRWSGSARAGCASSASSRPGEVLANAGRAHGSSADLGMGAAYVTGSTLKAVVLAGAIDDGVVSPADRVDCEHGSWAVQGKTLHDSGSYGGLSLPEMLQVSSNIGFAKIFFRLGGRRTSSWLRAFHFGEMPAVDGRSRDGSRSTSRTTPSPAPRWPSGRKSQRARFRLPPPMALWRTEASTSRRRSPFGRATPRGNGS